ncbi:hypothetical protein BKA80DRAFT_286265 [Phyllosticta citrichinensis]
MPYLSSLCTSVSTTASRFPLLDFCHPSFVTLHCLLPQKICPGFPIRNQKCHLDGALDLDAPSCPQTLRRSTLAACLGIAIWEPLQ